VFRNNDAVVVTGLANKTQVVTSALLAPTPGMLVKAIKPKSTLTKSDKSTSNKRVNKS
jgi:hypothetical protein